MQEPLNLGDASQERMGLRVVVFRVPLVMALCLLGLAGCVTADGQFKGPDAFAAATPKEALGTGTAPGLLGSDAYDDLSLGKKQFRADNFGLAEEHFRKAVESHPKDGEAWMGLAASYDRLNRFDLADRAYKEAIVILGPTPEILNNQGFSYILRGDYARARKVLRQAQAKDPRNPYILNNLKLLNKVASKGKAIE
jgi:Flp pilus assembly protein TadD